MKLRQWLLLIASMFALSLLAQEIGELPQKAKQEVILYKSAHIIGVGYVYKKQFVENQFVTFLRCPNNCRLKKKDGQFYIQSNKESLPLFSLSTLAHGIYFVKDGIPCLKGKCYFPANSIYEGLFLFRNTGIEENLLTTDAKKGRALYYEVLDIDNYKVKRWGVDISGRKQANGIYTFVIKFPYDSDISTLESTLSKDEIDAEIFNTQNLADILKSRQSVSMKLKNGDSFNGTVNVVLKNMFYEAVPLKGEYKYSTGEAFVGNYQEICFRDEKISVPSDGKTIFADGTTVEGDWLKRYCDDFTRNDWNEIYKNSNSLTEIRNKVIAKQKVLDEEKRAKELAELRKKEEEERHKREEKMREIARKRYYISQYGVHYGTLIIKKELELGMTQEMVNEIYPKDDFFNCSEMIYDGNLVEVWTIKNWYLKLLRGYPKAPEALTFVEGELVAIIR